MSELTFEQMLEESFKTIRNLSNAVAIAAFEALRQNGYPYLQ
mgnify:CR=1 FL=1